MRICIGKVFFRTGSFFMQIIFYFFAYTIPMKKNHRSNVWSSFSHINSHRIFITYMNFGNKTIRREEKR